MSSGAVSLAEELRSRIPGVHPEADPDEPERPFLSLRDLLDDPEILRPPPPVVWPYGYRGRSVLVVAPDKAGKSTLAAHAVGDLTNGTPHLGRRNPVGTALVVAPDEALGDTVRRLQEVGAHPDRVRVLVGRPPHPLAALTTALAEEPADLVLVDSLAEWARITSGTAPDDGDSSGWGAVVRPLVQVSRDFDVALLILHHPRRSDGQYRGSGEIAAAVDCLWEMTMPQSGEDPTLRRFRGRARWEVEDFSIRLEGDRFVLGGGGVVSVEARILLDLGQNPGTSRNAQHGRVGGRRETYLAAVNRLLETQAIQEQAGKLFRPEDVEVPFV
jgi:hypothetical protein